MWHRLVTLRWAAKVIGVLGIVGLAVYGRLKWPKTVPQKIRVLDRLRRIFPQWTLQRQARVIEHAFDPEIAKAKAKKDWEALQNIGGQCVHESAEYWDALAELRSNRLAKKASKRGILTEGLEWETGNYANRYLTRASETKLRRAVIEERRKDWEFRLKIIGALTGLVGTLIGLVALLTRR
jgi:hypothetical protein